MKLPRWMSPLATSPSNEVHCWDYSFEWTHLHQTAEKLRPLIYTYDSLADECLQRLQVLAESTESQQPSQDNNDKSSRKNLFALLKDNADDDPKLKELWTQVHTVPAWVSWEQIKRGQEVFYRYGLPILNVLNYESLLGGMGAGRVVETLSRTGGFSSKVARRRTFETLQHVLQVTRSLEDIKPGGAGHISSVRVRLLHAAVRQKILDLTDQQPSYYDVKRYGIPINDLDCIGTINTFSTSVVWVGLPRQGIRLRDQEIDDYIALWRLVAHYMGTPTEPFETRAKGRAMMESLLASEIQPTDMSKILAQNIILSMENTPPAYASKGFIEAMVHQLNGRQLAEKLGIPAPSFYYKWLVYGYCVFAMSLAYTIRNIPSLDRKSIKSRRKRYYRMITDNKIGLGGETRFDFQYIPSLSRTTHLGRRTMTKAEKHGIETLGQIGLGVALFLVTVLGILCAISARALHLDLLVIGFLKYTMSSTA